MHNEPDNEKQGSGVQPPDGSTERERFLGALRHVAELQPDPRLSIDAVMTIFDYVVPSSHTAVPDDPKDLRVREALARLVAAADWKERSDFQDDYNNACLEMDAVIEYNNARLEFAAAMEAARSALALHSGEEI